jgi:alpha-L-fucosidase
VAKGNLGQDIRMDEMVAKARAKQPGLIVVDRAVQGIHQNYLTPENQVPDQYLPYPWESCIIAGGGWAWVPHAQYMTSRKAIQMLVDIVAKGGNLLLNIGPAPDGTWDPGAYELLAQIGKWTRLNAEAIYGTRAVAPFKSGKVAFTRGKSGAVYAIYLPSEDERQMPARISLGSLSVPSGARVSLLGNTTALDYHTVGSECVVSVPHELAADPYCESAWVLKIQSVN